MVFLGTVFEKVRGKVIQTPATPISEIDVQFKDL